MFAILISLMIFPDEEPKVIAMPFVMTMKECQKMASLETSSQAEGMTFMSICHPLDRDAAENLRFSADAVLRGLVD